MSTSTILAAPTPTPKESLPSFENWLKTKANILTLPLLIAILNLMVNLASHFGGNSLPEVLFKDSLFKSHVLQGCLILVLLLAVPKSFESTNSNHLRAKAAAEDFRNAWLFTLFAWLMLYIAFAIEKSPSLTADHRNVLSL